MRGVLGSHLDILEAAVLSDLVVGTAGGYLAVVVEVTTEICGDALCFDAEAGKTYQLKVA